MGNFIFAENKVKKYDLIKTRTINGMCYGMINVFVCLSDYHVGVEGKLGSIFSHTRM